MLTGVSTHCPCCGGVIFLTFAGLIARHLDDTEIGGLDEEGNFDSSCPASSQTLEEAGQWLPSFLQPEWNARIPSLLQRVDCATVPF